jgi:hypothetical protein
MLRLRCFQVGRKAKHEPGPVPDFKAIRCETRARCLEQFFGLSYAALIVILAQKLDRKNMAIFHEIAAHPDPQLRLDPIAAKILFSSTVFSPIHLFS